MRKILFFLFSLLFLPSLCFAQSSTVSGTVTDAGGQTWNNGTVQFQFLNLNPQGGYVWTGGAFNPNTPINGTLSGTGTYSVSIPRNDAISPGGSQWRILACSAAFGPQNFCFTSAPVTINSATQTVNLTPPAISISCGSGASAYLDSEVQCGVGGTYYNLVSASLRVCTTVAAGACTTWAASGGSSSPSNLTTFFNKYYGLAPDDCGNIGCTAPVTPAIRYVKFCYDGVVTGAPSTTFKSLGTATVTNTVLTNNVATYTISGAAPLASGELITVTGSTNGGGVFNVTNQPILNYFLGATTFTIAITNANVGSAADTGTATGSCANFQALDTTSTIEILQGGLASALDVSTTISAVVSASQVTLGATAGTNATGKKFWYGTDATTPLQNWQNAINAGIPTAIGLQTHSGYLPGMYLTTKPVRLINPLGAFTSADPNLCSGTTGAGYGTPEPFSLQNANESLYIAGQGDYRSGLVAGSQFNWASAGTGKNTGVFYFSCWNGPTIQNFAVLSGDYGIAFNTSTLTGKFGGFFDDANSHSSVSAIEMENFHNTTSSLIADQMGNGTFESVRNNIQIYNNDCAGTYGSSTGNVASMRGISWNGYVWGGTRGSGCADGAVVFSGGTSGLTNSLHITNFIMDTENSADIPAGTILLKFANAFGPMDDNDEIQFENGRIQSAQPNSFLIATGGGTSKMKASFTNVNLVNTGTAGASTQLLLIQNAVSDFNFFGGSLGCNGTCANGISNATGSVIHTHGTRQFGTIGVVGTGAANVSLITPNTTGWSGPGTVQSTQYVSNQGTACTNGELALSAGWQSTGAATVTAVAGTGQTCSWTITTGTTTAANPTVTDTLTNPLPTATTVCELNIHGGTHTGVVNEGFAQTTLSATAPVFTADFTPTAGGTTYLVTRRCGP